MAKDPALLFYFQDWQGGTMLMSRFLKGCYMDLLCAQFNNGHLSIDEIKIFLGSDFGSAWPALQKKFVVDDKGLYYNKRLEDEQVRRQSFTKSRRENLKSDSKKETDSHMENVNDTEAKVKTRKGMLIPTLEEVQEYFSANGYPKELALRFFNGYNEANWIDSQGQAMKNWKQKAQHVWFKEENKKTVIQHNFPVSTTALPIYWNYVPDKWDEAFYKRIENENDAVRKIQAYEKKLKVNGYQKTATGWEKR